MTRTAAFIAFAILAPVGLVLSTVAVVLLRTWVGDEGFQGVALLTPASVAVWLWLILG